MIAFRSMIIFLSLLFYLFSMIVVLGENQVAGDKEECYKEARCGEEGPAIRFPFRIKNRQPAHCGYPGFELYCTSTNGTALELPNFRITVFVDKIYYAYQALEVHNPDKCSFREHNLRFLNLSISPFQLRPSYSGCTLYNCSSNKKSAGRTSLTCLPCLSGHGYSICAGYSGSIWFDLGDLVSCRKAFDLSAVEPQFFEPNPTFHLVWSEPDCFDCERKGNICRLKRKGAMINETECFKISKQQKGATAMIISSATAGSLILLLAGAAIVHAYTHDKSDRENRKRIKKFLEDYVAFKPSRYTYNDIKKITNRFKEEIGQGAYGTVFKGKLSAEVFVAVKMLNNNSQGNGDEFINEVATIGRIHHVNVVRLVGYCAEGVRRALVYEFLPNHSLDEHMSMDLSGENRSLSWESLQDIALGIAKGIEYLHQGCDQRILHFDIKPRNILLDQNFIPKISDFGVAKLCSKDQSAVSMTAARGTVGYIAPEVFSRNFGNVSYKSDVYSFGMLLLEMVGKRKSSNVSTEQNVEEIYYPEWIYNLLEDGEDLRIQIEEEGGGKIAKKLAVVGLWCIQWHPIGRPSMKVVVQMLEGQGDQLTMPPNPFASSGSSIGRTRRSHELESIAE